MRYNFYKNARLDTLIAKDLLEQSILNNILFDNNNAIVSDGNNTFIIPIKEISNFSDKDISLLNGKMINANSYKKLLDFDYVAIKENEISGLSNVTIKLATICDKYSDYPDFKEYINAKSKIDFTGNFEITFDLDIINKVSKILGNKYFVEKYDEKKSVITFCFVFSNAKIIIPIIHKYEEEIERGWEEEFNVTEFDCINYISHNLN